VLKCAHAHAKQASAGTAHRGTWRQLAHGTEASCRRRKQRQRTIQRLGSCAKAAGSKLRRLGLLQTNLGQPNRHAQQLHDTSHTDALSPNNQTSSSQEWLQRLRRVNEDGQRGAIATLCCLEIGHQDLVKKYTSSVGSLRPCRERGQPKALSKPGGQQQAGPLSRYNNALGKHSQGMKTAATMHAQPATTALYACQRAGAPEHT
jgi:hypothetical protein